MKQKTLGSLGSIQGSKSFSYTDVLNRSKNLNNQYFMKSARIESLCDDISSDDDVHDVNDDYTDLRTEQTIKNQLLWQIWMLGRIDEKIKQKSKKATLYTFISGFEECNKCQIFKIYDNFLKISKIKSEQQIKYQEFCTGLIKIGIEDVKSFKKFQMKLNGFVSSNNLKDECELECAVLNQIYSD
ncbi:Hypothetical_protein [Hexamita inflata]|uniref:Hypothetical_protein n=1 Tax=Hexamita inflata TaxID=28002 RepID=A0AA86RHZ4_9EUKA|nr:Hypothetical protein HINF_LOCUS1294 [Hexamita inflata]CAI9975128.1 Hypothetical protein HINF_LOCUS62773 [Hexamita inflata]